MLTLDTDTHIFFYEQNYYCFSNFSAFRIRWQGHDFDTVEHAYHWTRFKKLEGHENWHQLQIRTKVRSAHEAFKYAQEYKHEQRIDWDAIKDDVMLKLLILKCNQHEYVKRKLMETGNKTLVENSWRDSYWGWGQDRKGKNMLGKLWMEARAYFRPFRPEST